MSEKKINLLVLPTLFPKFKGDISGIFILDYIECVKPYCNVTVLFLRIFGEPGLKKEESDSVIIYRYCLFKESVFLKPLKPVFYFFLFLKGKSIAKENTNPDIIHAHGTVLNGSLALMIKSVFNVPVVLTEHSPVYKLDKSRILLFISRFIVKRVNCLLTVSKDLEKQFFDAQIIPQKSIVTFNPVNTQLFKPLLKEPSILPNNIIFVARLEDYKGGVKVSNAFIRLLKKFPDWKLTFIGTGPDLEKIKKIKESHGKAGEAILLKGQLSKKEIAEEIAQSSFMVMPSEHETFGLVYAEAMAAGIPVIAGNQTAPKEFIDESCGMLVNPFSEQEIENAMGKMMDEYKKYDKETLRQNIIDKFGFEAFGKKLNTIYTNAIDDNKK